MKSLRLTHTLRCGAVAIVAGACTVHCVIRAAQPPTGRYAGSAATGPAETPPKANPPSTPPAQRPPSAPPSDVRRDTPQGKTTLNATSAGTLVAKFKDKDFSLEEAIEAAESHCKGTAVGIRTRKWGQRFHRGRLRARRQPTTQVCHRRS